MTCATVFLDVINALSCIRFTIISYVIVSPRFDFLGCGGRYDIFGFSDARQRQHPARRQVAHDDRRGGPVRAERG
jgi:hypothetical protein